MVTKDCFLNLSTKPACRSNSESLTVFAKGRLVPELQIGQLDFLKSQITFPKCYKEHLSKLCGTGKYRI